MPFTSFYRGSVPSRDSPSNEFSVFSVTLCFNSFSLGGCS